MKSNCKNELVKLISLCGQIAEHKSEKMQQHNIDDAELISELSIEEQKELENLLNKLRNKWFEDHKKRMQKSTAEEQIL